MLSAVVTGAGSMAGPVSAAPFRFSLGPWMQLAGSVDQVFPILEPASRMLAGANALSYNGKLTVLLLGSDWRRRSGERLDTIMVMSIDSAKNIKAVSIPRDSARIPIYTGGTYKSKINGMLKYFKKQAGGSRSGGLDRFRREVEYLLGIKIDYLAYVRFEGFDALVDRVDHVTVSIPNELRDPTFIDKPGWPTGAKFLAGSSQLGGGNEPRCYGGYPKPVTNWSPVMNCHRALVYVRSRHGTLVGCCGNNDYKRAARQQKFVFDAIRRVTNDYNSSITSGLRSTANANPISIYTTIPASSDLQMWSKLNGSSFNPSTGSKVFSPPTYAHHIKGTSSNTLDLTAIRNLCNSWFDDN
jgi:anionic cell wall polymer biosynthesis LytR-Cps2A-Psr (LCP) family protein